MIPAIRRFQSHLALSLFIVAATTSAGQIQTPPAPVAAAAPGRPADHVILITIDGFRPAVYRDAAGEGVNLPHLQSLREGGSAADGVMVAYPSMTYPSHTSIVTGVWPARHGIVSNTSQGRLRTGRRAHRRNRTGHRESGHVGGKELEALGADPGALFMFEPARATTYRTGSHRTVSSWAPRGAAPTASCPPNRGCSAASSFPGRE